MIPLTSCCQNHGQPRATVNFSARAVGSFADTASTATIPLAFNNRGTLTVWIVPVNTGSVGSPVLPPQNEIDRRKATCARSTHWLYHLCPEKLERAGVVTGEPITALNTYYNNVVLPAVQRYLHRSQPYARLTRLRLHPLRRRAVRPGVGGRRGPRGARVPGHFVKNHVPRNQPQPRSRSFPEPGDIM